MCFCECEITRAVNLMDAVTMPIKYANFISQRPVLGYNRMELSGKGHKDRTGF
jgi:hypothetical protein